MNDAETRAIYEAERPRDAIKDYWARILEQASEITTLRAQLEEARAKAIEDAARIAEGWPATAGGDEYQTSGNGRFWDAGNTYDQARIDAAFEIRALIAGSTK